MSYYFVILGSTNDPIYELDIGTYKQNKDGKTNLPPEINQLKQFIANAALDILESVQFKSKQHFFSNIDAFYGYATYIYLTQGNTKFILLTNCKNADESMRQFCIEIHELYVKKLMSPFYDFNSPIRSKVFDSKVRQLAKKYL